jgi:hypothetical protein
MQLMDKYYAAMRQRVDPALDPITMPAAQFSDKMKSITDAITSASTATDNFGQAWERAGLRVAKILGDMAVAKWGPGATSRLGSHPSHSDPVAAIASAVTGGMPVPSAAKGGGGVAGFFKAAGLGAFVPAKASSGSAPVTVNLYNQGSPATVTKTTATGGGSGGSGGLEAELEKQVVSIFMKDATSNGPMWQAITSAVAG